MAKAIVKVDPTASKEEVQKLTKKVPKKKAVTFEFSSSSEVDSDYESDTTKSSALDNNSFAPFCSEEDDNKEDERESTKNNIKSVTKTYKSALQGTSNVKVERVKSESNSCSSLTKLWPTNLIF